jgi:hypothetical protein
MEKWQHCSGTPRFQEDPMTRLDPFRLVPALLVAVVGVASLLLTLPAASSAQTTDGTRDAREAPGQEASTGAQGSVATLGWLVGSWEGRLGESVIEEAWLPPVDGEMLGSFRWSKAPPLYEALLIAEEDGAAVLWLRHFGPGLKAWEDRDGALRFDAVTLEPGRAVFESEEDGKRVRLGYERKGDDGLLAWLETTEPGSEAERLEFSYRRR